MKASLILEKAERDLEIYDSSVDTLKHKQNVEKYISKFVEMLLERGTVHDDSKLRNPEKKCYDKFIPMLQKVKYGTPEYDKLKKEMQKEGLDHHFKVNRHHPEHFEKGISGMNLLDLVEMFLDWYSASKRSDTSFKKGVEMNLEKYSVEGILADVFRNSANLFGED